MTTLLLLHMLFQSNWSFFVKKVNYYDYLWIFQEVSKLSSNTNELISTDKLDFKLEKLKTLI